MTVTLTILCENSVGKPGHLVGEHGFSCLVETPQAKLLFDAGQGLGLVQNVREMGLSLNDIQGVALSHGHYDHSGGLAVLLSLQAPLTIWGHPDIFQKRFWRSEFELRSIGMPMDRKELEERGASFVLTATPRELVPGAWLSGEIPRRTNFEDGDAHLGVPAAD